MEDIEKLVNVAKNIEGRPFVHLVKRQHGQCKVLLNIFMMNLIIIVKHKCSIVAA